MTRQTERTPKFSAAQTAAVPSSDRRGLSDTPRISVQRCACEDEVQRKEASAGFGHDFSQIRVQRDDDPGSIPLNGGGGGGSTTVQPPSQATTAFSGNSLKEVSDAMPPEPGAVDFDIHTATNGDPITSATVTVSQVMTLPTWTELGQQCPAAKQGWNSFISALRSHENGHVTRDNQQFAGAHKNYVGSAQSDTQTVTDALRVKVQAVQDQYDAATTHGVTGTPPTIIDTSIVCPPKTADAGPDAAAGDDGTQVASLDTSDQTAGTDTTATGDMDSQPDQDTA